MSESLPFAFEKSTRILSKPKSAGDLQQHAQPSTGSDGLGVTATLVLLRLSGVVGPRTFETGGHLPEMKRVLCLLAALLAVAPVCSATDLPLDRKTLAGITSSRTHLGYWRKKPDSVDKLDWSWGLKRRNGYKVVFPTSILTYWFILNKLDNFRIYFLDHEPVRLFD
jgi:hypothetical protein